MREYFMKSKRIGFSKWEITDLDFATQLWGEKEVTRFICASGIFTQQDIRARLDEEIRTNELFGIQYWPIFALANDELIGCCGIHPFDSEESTYEIGAHLRKKYWGQGYGFEASQAVIDFSFTVLKADRLFAGHHPLNTSSEKLLKKLGFRYLGNSFYKPTGLYHPSYELLKNELSVK